MRRKEFFDNFVNITKFGIFGSLFTYVIFVGLFYLLFKYADMGTTIRYNAEKHAEEEADFKPATLDIMLFCTILVSSDIIAAMSIVKFELYPHIFSIILGEGLFNDVVVFTLY
jgi:NhaP-type Na+/H+ or K+/H+ antiporter